MRRLGPGTRRRRSRRRRRWLAKNINLEDELWLGLDRVHAPLISPGLSSVSEGPSKVDV
jgi:hypothetical protein